MIVLFLLTGCGDALTSSEAQSALQEAVASSKSEALTTEVVEITTDFTLGQAVEAAAEEMAAFVQSQVPCSTVTRDGATVTVDFGTLDDACVYNGHTYAGVAEVTVTRSDDEVEVLHAWTGLTDGEVTVDGEATVTWSASERTRHVVHALTWDDGERTVEASGDRTQSLVDEVLGLAGGIEVNGTREWTSDAGTWSLDIDGVQMRAQDPCPQDGTYELTTPSEKVATLAFERQDEDTIRVTLEGARRARVWDITASGVETVE